MAIKIKKERRYEIPFEDKENDVSFKVTYLFVPREDLDKTELRKKLKDQSVNSKLEQLELAGDTTDYILRKSIIGIEGFIDEDTGKELSLYKEDGSIDEQIQKAVFEVVCLYPDTYKDALLAYLGPKGKNLKTGATE